MGRPGVFLRFDQFAEKQALTAGENLV